MAMCPRCQQSLPDPAPSFCPHCGAATLGASTGTPPPATPPAAQPPPAAPTPPGPYPPGAAAPSGPIGNPWQRRDQLGIVAAFAESAKDALFAPAEFFQSTRHPHGIGEPLAYGVIVGWLAQIVASFYQLILNTIVGSSFADYGEMPEVARAFMSQMEGVGWFVITALFGWVLVLIGLFISSALIHVVLLITGWAKRDYEATLGVTSYGQSAMLWNVVPFCGGLIGAVHWLVLATVGVSEAHGISRGQALVAVLLPLLLCCCCIPGVIGVFLGGLGAMLGSMG